eukprot:COSAG05_NODE_4167_length_1643_cov_1.808938_1_plen_84_part_00
MIQVLVDCFPNAVARMDPLQFQSLMESLAWGLDADVDGEHTQRLCLQSMAESRNVPSSVYCSQVKLLLRHHFVMGGCVCAFFR